jgi:bacterioferritin-associated ferredoxin
MIVCHCTALNDREVREQIDAGAASATDVADRCGAGAHCGGCLPALERLLDEHDGADAAFT